MSSVSGSDSSNRSSGQDDVVRRTREEAQAKETEMAKKHQKEIRRLNETQYKAMENLKAAQAEQVEQIMKNSSQDVSAREHKHIQDVEEMRNMHRKQLQQVADEGQKKQEIVRNSLGGELEQQKIRTEDKVRRLSEDQSRERADRSNQFESSMVEAKDEQKSAIDNNREKLTKAYEKKMNDLVQDRDRKTSHMQGEYDDFRQDANMRLKNQELKHMRENKHASDNLLHTVQNERARRLDSENILRDGFDDGLNRVREKYDQALKEHQQAGSAAHQNLAGDVGDRIENQVRRLEMENSGLKEGRVRNQLQNKAAKDREIRNLADAFSKNLESYKMERDEVVHAANANNHADIKKIHEEKGKQMVDAHRFYREKSEMLDMRNKAAFNGLKEDTDIRMQQSKVNADSRVDSVMDRTDTQMTQAAEVRKLEVALTKEAHHEEMKALRAQLESDKNQSLGRLTDRLRKQEVQHNEKMQTVMAKYEKQILGLQEQMLRERKANEMSLRRATEEMQRTHKAALDQVDAATKDKVRAMQVQHSDELRKEDKRHDEKLNQVLSDIKRT